MIAANAAALDLYRRAWIPEQSFEVSTRYLALAEKAARTLARLSEALDRHRGKGQQQITVKHVTVNADQAVVADTVVGGSKGPVEISNDGNNAPLLLEARHAPGLALAKRVRKGPGSRASHRPLVAGPCVACTGLVAGRQRAKRTATTRRANTRPRFAKREGLSKPSFVGRKRSRRLSEARAPPQCMGLTRVPCSSSTPSLTGSTFPKNRCRRIGGKLAWR